MKKNKVDIFTRIEWSIRHHHYMKQQENAQKKEEKEKVSKTAADSVNTCKSIPVDEVTINDYCEQVNKRMKLSERFKKMKKQEKKEEKKPSSEMTEEEKNQAACDFAVKNFTKNLEVAEASAK